MRISTCLHGLDWIPVASTASNLFHIFKKTCGSQNVDFDYGCYLQSKTFTDHVFLSVPFLNIFYKFFIKIFALSQKDSYYDELNNLQIQIKDNPDKSLFYDYVDGDFKKLLAVFCHSLRSECQELLTLCVTPSFITPAVLENIFQNSQLHNRPISKKSFEILFERVKNMPELLPLLASGLIQHGTCEQITDCYKNAFGYPNSRAEDIVCRACTYGRFDLMIFLVERSYVMPWQFCNYLETALRYSKERFLRQISESPDVEKISVHFLNHHILPHNLGPDLIEILKQHRKHKALDTFIQRPCFLQEADPLTLAMCLQYVLEFKSIALVDKLLTHLVSSNQCYENALVAVCLSFDKIQRLPRPLNRADFAVDQEIKKFLDRFTTRDLPENYHQKAITIFLNWNLSDCSVKLLKKRVPQLSLEHAVQAINYLLDSLPLDEQTLLSVYNQTLWNTRSETRTFTSPAICERMLLKGIHSRAIVEALLSSCAPITEVIIKAARSLLYIDPDAPTPSWITPLPHQNIMMFHLLISRTHRVTQLLERAELLYEVTQSEREELSHAFTGGYDQGSFTWQAAVSIATRRNNLHALQALFEMARRHSYDIPALFLSREVIAAQNEGFLEIRNFLESQEELRFRENAVSATVPQEAPRAMFRWMHAMTQALVPIQAHRAALLSPSPEPQRGCYIIDKEHLKTCPSLYLHSLALHGLKPVKFMTQGRIQEGYDAGGLTLQFIHLLTQSLFIQEVLSITEDRLPQVTTESSSLDYRHFGTMLSLIDQSNATRRDKIKLDDFFSPKTFGLIKDFLRIDSPSSRLLKVAETSSHPHFQPLADFLKLTSPSQENIDTIKIYLNTLGEDDLETKTIDELKSICLDYFEAVASAISNIIEGLKAPLKDRIERLGESIANDFIGRPYSLRELVSKIHCLSDHPSVLLKTEWLKEKLALEFSRTGSDWIKRFLICVCSQPHLPETGITVTGINEQVIKARTCFKRLEVPIALSYQHIENPSLSPKEQFLANLEITMSQQDFDME